VLIPVGLPFGLNVGEGVGLALVHAAAGGRGSGGGGGTVLNRRLRRRLGLYIRGGRCLHRGPAGAECAVLRPAKRRPPQLGQAQQASQVGASASGSAAGHNASEGARQGGGRCDRHTPRALQRLHAHCQPWCAIQARMLPMKLYR
jgi:hypothetical protein